MRRMLTSSAVAIILGLGMQAASAAPIKFVVFFQEWSAALDDPAQAAITAASDYAKQHPRDPILVAGVADPTGSAEANDLLSKLRAQRVIDQMIDAGIPKARMRRVGRGSQDFSLTSQESRRVEVSIGH